MLNDHHNVKPFSTDNNKFYDNYYEFLAAATITPRQHQVMLLTVTMFAC